MQPGSIDSMEKSLGISLAVALDILYSSEEMFV